MRRRRTLYGLMALALLAACAQRPPAMLQAQYEPPGNKARALPKRRQRNSVAAPVCRLHVGAVGDRRSDPNSLGEISGRPVRAIDVPAWIHSGLASLGDGGRITMAEDAVSDLAVSADIQKVYVMSAATTKAADVVFTLHYSRGGAAAGDKVYRGSHEGTNWAGSEEETQSALNQALADALNQVRDDVIARCAGRAAE